MENAIDAGKIPWDFVPTQRMAPEIRQMRALEHIAHYLDRIDLHLAKIAYALTQDPPGGNMSMLKSLQDVADALREAKED